MNPAILKFLESDTSAQMEQVRVGFELETQRSMGLEWNDNDNEDGDIDHDAASDAIQNEVNDYFNSNINRQLRGMLSESLTEKLQDLIREKIEEDFDYGPYTSSTSAVDSIESQYTLPNIEIVEDGSVSGFEFRTMGALTSAEFDTAAKSVFRIGHVIDTECSFHVHVSLPGVEHSYGERMQIAMVEYIAEHLDQLPESVRKRIRDYRDNRFIQGLVSSREKYSFIHAHPQGTWEFRCFGNVQNAEEGIACKAMAVAALQYAYQATKGTSRLITDGIDGDVKDFLSKSLSRAVKPSRLISDNQLAEDDQSAA